MKVIMFHSVGNVENNWYRNWLSTEINQFETFCKFLNRKKYNTILLDEWYFLQDNPNEIKGNELVLTFDDGYLDNWVFAYPILKKYGLKGTIFINPEFVDPCKGLRPNLDNVIEGKIKIEDLSSLGFANWDEIIKMDSDRVIDVQSHSMSHNFYFHSNKIIDLYNNQDKFDWIPWIDYKDKKPYYITENQKNLIPLGYPVFEHYRALGLRRYFPDEKIVEMSIELFQKKTQSTPQIIEILSKELLNYPGRFETDEEMEQRFRYELFESKKILEEKLNKKIDFLCWPGGGYNDLSINLSIEAGYKASTIASRDKYTIIDNTCSYKRIQRYGMGSFIVVGMNKNLVKSNSYLVQVFLGRNGNKFYRNFNRLRKLKMIVENYLK